MRRTTRLTVPAAALALACAAAPAACVASSTLISVPSPVSPSGPPLVKVSTPEPSAGGQLVGVEAGGEPLVGVSTPETRPGGQIVGVSVGGENVVSVPTPGAPSTPPPGLPGGEAPGGKGSPPGSTAPSSPGSPVASAAGSGSGPSAATGSPHGALAQVAQSASPAGSAARKPDELASNAHRASRHRDAHTTAPAAHASAPFAPGSPGAKLRASGYVARSSRGTSGNPLQEIGRHIPLPLPVPDWSKPIILALLALAVALGIRGRVAARRARRLEAQRASLSRDIAAMQSALVPAVPPAVGEVGVSVAYRPAEGPAAGGDFYDVFEPSPGKVAVIVGDVAGHGHEALTQAALARYTVRAYLQAGLEPRAALALAGRAFADPSCEHLATVAAAAYDCELALLTYALAGHPPPVIRGRVTREPLAVCCSPPIGWSEPTGRRQSTIPLAAGAQACFFTDGLTEARIESGPDRGLLGRERLAEIFAGLDSDSSAARLLGAVRDAAAATPDDMAACIISPRVATRGLELEVEELETDLRSLEAGHVAEFLAGCGVAGARVLEAVEEAREIAGANETVLLRVERSGTDARASSAVARASGADAPDRPGGEVTVTPFHELTAG
jgi:serine phosphatase RsbU (regulator of sigma subunit)